MVYRRKRSKDDEPPEYWFFKGAKDLVEEEIDMLKCFQRCDPARLEDCSRDQRDPAVRHLCLLMDTVRFYLG